MNSDSCNLTPAVPRDAVYFLSDLHLGASYFSSPVETERRVVRFLKSIAADAAEIYLVGDVLDYWYEYRYVVPRGHTRFFGALAELADSGVKITWMIGNHDIWIFDYLTSELGIEVVDGTLVRDMAMEWGVPLARSDSCALCFTTASARGSSPRCTLAGLCLLRVRSAMTTAAVTLCLMLIGGAARNPSSSLPMNI